jgi:hypothetical protein
MLHTTPDAGVALLVNIPPLRRFLVEVCGEPRPALESRWPSQAAQLVRDYLTDKLASACDVQAWRAN